MAGPTGKIAMVAPGLITECEIIPRRKLDTTRGLFQNTGIWRSNLRPSARHRKDNPVPEHTA